jgi:2-polyprenyl-3-methyl-5-hydroxy-6-metoxy-1,4-benzoquinol methylase
MKRTRFVPKSRLVDRNDYILSCSRGKSVLHIGMGGFVDDPTATEKFVATAATDSLHAKLSRVTSRLDGIDINPMSLDAMQKAVPGRYILCDVCAPDFPDKIGSARYDLVVFGDAIEHLDDCRSALRNLAGALNEGGSLLISTVNAYCFDSIVKMLFRYESVHEEHTAYFSYMTLKRLLEMNGLRIKDFCFCTYKQRPRFSGPLHRISFMLSSLPVRVFPQFAMGVILLADKATGEGTWS